MKRTKLIYRICKWYKLLVPSVHDRRNDIACKEEGIIIHRSAKKLLGVPWIDKKISRSNNWKDRSKSKHQYDKLKLTLEDKNLMYHDMALKDEFLFVLKKLKAKDGVGWFYFDIDQTFVRYFPKGSFSDVVEKLYKEGLIIAECIHEDNIIVFIRCKIRD